MKNRWMWLPILAAALGAVLFLGWTNSKAGVISHVRRNVDKLELYAQNCAKSPERYSNYNGWSVGYSFQDASVTFQVSYLGFGSQADQKGFYYTPDDQPRTKGCDLGQEQREEQILFLGEGDNYVLTEKIAPNWFWYEQHW